MKYELSYICSLCRPSFAHDHVPYSLDHSNFFDHSYSSSDSVDPYSAYSGSFSQDITATAEEVPPTAPGTHRVGRRSLQQQANYRRQETETTMNTEERHILLITYFDLT